MRIKNAARVIARHSEEIAAMRIENLSFGYDEKKLILENFNCVFKKGKITSIIGPNGCGKSTLLGVCNRLNKAKSGRVFLDGKEIAEYGGKEFAKKAACVHQINEIPVEITARGLVAYGRTPRKKMFERLNDADEEIINYAIEKTGLKQYENKPVSELSGGEKQRVFIALALCQQPEIMFLDEPTSFLDVYYQLEIMEIIREINREKGITVVMVLHDVNHAVKYSDDIIVMKNGGIEASGNAKKTVTEELIKRVFGVYAEEIKTREGESFFATALPKTMERIG
jgi:iron complex transport system ATP-binding protein